MRILGIEHSTREYIYLLLIMIAILGFFINSYMFQLTIRGYHKSLNECIENYNMKIENIIPQAGGGEYGTNFTYNLGRFINESNIS